MPKSGQTYFQEWWLDDPTYNEWLKRAKDDDKLFICDYCNKSKRIALSNMGITALNSHMKGDKHKRIHKMRQRSIGELPLKSNRHQSVSSTSESQKKDSVSAGFSKPELSSPMVLHQNKQFSS